MSKELENGIQSGLEWIVLMMLALEAQDTTKDHGEEPTNIHEYILTNNKNQEKIKIIIPLYKDKIMMDKDTLERTLNQEFPVAAMLCKLHMEEFPEKYSFQMKKEEPIFTFTKKESKSMDCPPKIELQTEKQKVYYYSHNGIYRDQVIVYDPESDKMENTHEQPIYEKNEKKIRETIQKSWNHTDPFNITKVFERTDMTGRRIPEYFFKLDQEYTLNPLLASEFTHDNIRKYDLIVLQLESDYKETLVVLKRNSSEFQEIAHYKGIRDEDIDTLEQCINGILTQVYFRNKFYGEEGAVWYITEMCGLTKVNKEEKPIESTQSECECCDCCPAENYTWESFYERIDTAPHANRISNSPTDARYVQASPYLDECIMQILQYPIVHGDEEEYKEILREMGLKDNE